MFDGQYYDQIDGGEVANVDFTLCRSLEDGHRARGNFGAKRPRGSGLFETALSSLDSVYKKLRQTPQNPTKTMK